MLGLYSYEEFRILGSSASFRELALSPKPEPETQNPKP